MAHTKAGSKSSLCHWNKLCRLLKHNFAGSSGIRALNVFFKSVYLVTFSRLRVETKLILIFLCYQTVCTTYRKKYTVLWF